MSVKQDVSNIMTILSGSSDWIVGMSLRDAACPRMGAIKFYSLMALLEDRGIIEGRVKETTIGGTLCRLREYRAK